jgi:pyruvate dehydrogenase (quinone)
MALTSADFLLQRLHENGVRRIYGYPGDGINAIVGALERQKELIDFVQVRHEEQAAFMACAHAKWTGEVGVCLATSGPGAIHLLNGLYDAKLDHAPVLAIVGQQSRMALGGSYQQEVDLQTLFKDVAHEYCETALVPEQIRHLVDRAHRIALDQRAVTCLIVPNDIGETEAVPEPPRKHGTIHSSPGWSAPRVVPARSDLEQAAEILNAGEKVAILVGQGARGATNEVMALAEKLGAGVAKALLGRTVLDDTLPYCTGSIGLLGTKPSWTLMNECDTFLMVGSSFPYSEFLPEPGQARGVQIDLDGRMLNIRYPMELGLVGDAQATIEELLALLQPRTDTAWRTQIEDEVAEWWRLIEDRAMQDADPINPQRLFWQLNHHLPDDAIVTSDSGSAANWFARDLKLGPTHLASLSGNLATMGAGVPYAIAAKFAHPSRPAVALVGDGAMQMNGMAELITAAKYYESWADRRLVVLVLNNRDLNQVTWEQRALEGDPKNPATQQIPDVRYADFARLIGLDGVRIESPDAIDAAWEEAFQADRPFVIDAVTDPEVPPLPPHITVEQARHFISAVRGGDPHSRALITESFKQKILEFLPGR